jgi:outer membrane protein
VKNNTSLVLNVILAIAVVILYILHFSGNQASNNTSNNTNSVAKTNTKSTTSGEGKVAYINTDTLMEKYEFAKATKKDLETRGRLIEADLNSRKTSFQNDIASYQRTAGTMTQQKAQETEQLLALRERELTQYQQTQQTEFLKEEQKLNEKLRDNVNEFVKKYAEANGIAYVFSYSKNNIGVGMIYGVGGSDITLDILNGLNEEYKSGQKKK